MFGWFKKKKESQELQIVSSKLEFLQREIARWHSDQSEVLRKLEALKIAVDEKIKIEMADIQGRYIKALEGQMVRLDREANALMDQRDSERQRHTEYMQSLQKRHS